MTEHLLTDDCHPFGLNYDFLTTISDKTFNVNSRRQLSFDSDRFTAYGMKSFVFLYVLLYKSILLIAGMVLLLSAFAAVRLVRLCFSTSKLMAKVQTVFSNLVFWNFPL